MDEYTRQVIKFVIAACISLSFFVIVAFKIPINCAGWATSNVDGSRIPVFGPQYCNGYDHLIWYILLPLFTGFFPIYVLPLIDTRAVKNVNNAVVEKKIK